MNFVKLLYLKYFIIQYIENGVKIKTPWSKSKNKN